MRCWYRHCLFGDLIMKIATKLFLIFFIVFHQVSFAQTVELICEGEIETKLTNYKGGGKIYWKNEMKLEVSIDNKSIIIII